MMLLVLSAALQAAPVPAKPELKACDSIDPGQPFVTFDTQLVRAGDRVRIKPMVSHAWFGDEEVRWDCFESWAVSDPKLARIDAKTGALVIAADALPGSDVIVSATFRKTEINARAPVHSSLRIVARDAEVLTGTWTEANRTNCAGDRVAELIFGPRGGYRFTFSEMMIETMTSGGGTYSWDPKTLVLKMNDQSGVATFKDWTKDPSGAPSPKHRALVIGGIDFYPRPPVPPTENGTPAPPPPVCVFIFRRVE